MDYRSSRVWIVCFHIVLSSFIFAYTFGVFNTCAVNVSATLNWGDNEDLYVTLFSTFVPVGSFFGAMVTGSMMNYYGRRKTTMLGDLIIVLSSIITVIPFTPTFGIGRFCSGFVAGIFLTAAPNFVNEISPDEMIPKVGPLVQIAASIGFIFSYAFGLPLPNSDYNSNSFNNWWIFMFLFPGFVALYQFCFFAFYFKQDTPLWLFQKNKKQEAMVTLRYIYTDEGMQKGIERFSAYDNNNNEKSSDKKISSVTYKDLFTKRKFRKMVRIGILLGIIQQVSGINAGIFYSTQIFKELGGGDFMSKLYTLITSIVFMIASLVTIPLLSKYGRRPMLISGQILLAIDLIFLGIVTIIGGVNVAVLVIGVILIYIIFAYSLGGTLWVYLGEICNEKALTVSATVNLLLVCAVVAGFPITVRYLGISYAFFFFGGCMVISTIYCFFDIIETKGKTKPEILRKICA